MSNQDPRHPPPNSLRKGGPRKPPPSPIICRCNNVTQATIEEAIRNGANTMNEIFDLTTAGVGPCGGTCRRKILPLLEKMLKERGG